MCEIIRDEQVKSLAKIKSSGWELLVQPLAEGTEGQFTHASSNSKLFRLRTEDPSSCKHNNAFFLIRNLHVPESKPGFAL